MSTAPNLWSERWSVARVTFEVKAFLNITVLRGRLGRVDGSYEVTPGGGHLEFTADATSIDTGDPARNAQLLSVGGVDWSAHPEVRFSSSRVRRAPDGKLHVEGRLEAAGRVVPVEFDAAVRQAGDGLQLTGRSKIDQGLLGGPLAVPATLYIEVALTSADGRNDA